MLQRNNIICKIMHPSADSSLDLLADWFTATYHRKWLLVIINPHVNSSSHIYLIVSKYVYCNMCDHDLYDSSIPDCHMSWLFMCLKGHTTTAHVFIHTCRPHALILVHVNWPLCTAGEHHTRNRLYFKVCLSWAQYVWSHNVNMC